MGDNMMTLIRRTHTRSRLKLVAVVGDGGVDVEVVVCGVGRGHICSGSAYVSTINVLLVMVHSS